ncbi:MAG TPA: endonuclease/exonuclease/phosphatase family protein [Thermoanaerobaculia bacterium]|nr:endonuclease/exonuclease/phosphatase family protein [Thermoanaerobaculia bacterium]
MRLATWNIYWFGDRAGEHIIRSAEDRATIAEVIKNLSPDVLALQEIVDPLALEEVIRLANGGGKNYAIRSSTGQWFTSDPNPADVSNSFQKAFLCINTEAVEFLKGASIRGGPGGRRPYAAALRHRSSGIEFVAVVVHLRSGFPVFLDPADAEVRRREAAALARWLTADASGDNPDFPEPGSPRVIVLGDFNAELGDPNHSLDVLREGTLSEWFWVAPQPDAGQHATAIDDGYTIDFIILSPAALNNVETQPTIYAYDHDAGFGGPSRFHQGAGGTGPLKNYGVSDHRPVVAVLRY